MTADDRRGGYMRMRVECAFAGTKHEIGLSICAQITHAFG